MGERKVFVGRLPGDIREDEVEMIFETYGKVGEVMIMRDSRTNRDGDVQKAGFVTFETAKGAKTAIQCLDGVYKFRKDSAEPIHCSIALPPGSGKGGGKGGGKGSKGSDRGHDDRRRGDHDRGGRGYDDRESDDDRGRDRSHDDRGRGYDRDRGGGYDRDRGGYDRSYDRGSSGSYAGSRGDDRRAGSRSRSHDRGRDRARIEDSREHDRGSDRGHDRGYDGERSGSNRDYDRGGSSNDRGKPRSEAAAAFDRGSNRGGSGYERGGSRGDGHDRGQDRRGINDSYEKGREIRSAGNDGGGREGGPPGCKLYIANLPEDISRRDMDIVFSTYGRLEDIHIMTGKSTKNDQASAFVVYETLHGAKQAVAAMTQGYEIRPGEGNITVKYARSGGKGKGDDGRVKDGDRYRPY